MIDHDPLDTLRQQWLGEVPPRAIRVDRLRAEVGRRRRTLALVVLGEVLLTAALVWITVVMLRGDAAPPAGKGAALVMLWSSWAVAVAFATWNRRQALAGLGALAYVEQLARFARMRVRTASFVLTATIALLILFAASGWMTIPLLVVGAGYIVWAAWYGARARRDVERFRGIAAEFMEPDSGA